MRKRIGWVVAVVALLLGVPLLLVCSLHWQASTALARHDRDLQELIERFRARAQARWCAFGDPLPGDPAPLYDRVYARFNDMTDEEERAIRRDDPDDREIASILLRYAPTIDVLREALRRSPSGARILEDYQRNDGLDKAKKYLVAVVEHQARCGRSAEALESYFLLMGMFQNETWEAGAFSSLRAVEDLELFGKILKDHLLTIADLDRLLARFDGLERARPTLQDELDAEEIRQRMLVSDPNKDEIMAGTYKIGIYRPIQPSWKTLWSRNISRAKSLSEVEEHFRVRREIAARPWPEREPAATAYLKTQIGRWLDPPQGHGLQTEREECYETYAAQTRVLMHAALEVARYEVDHAEFPGAVPGTPRSPRSGLPLVLIDGEVVDAGPNFSFRIPVRRRH